MNFLPRNKTKILLCLIWLALFSAGLLGYAGSKLLYVCFSLVFLVLLLSGVYRQLTYGYLFLTVFLWLGFWFKLTANFLIFGFVAFGEPVGKFDGSPAAWDSVLWVAMVAALGTMIGRYIYGLSNPVSTCAVDKVVTVPAWYTAFRIPLWFAVIGSCIALAAINTALGIHQIGLSPKTTLPWPCNALIAWFVVIGGAIAISTLLNWEFQSRKNPILPMYFVLLEGLVSTTSLLSRGVYLFHTVPQIMVLSLNRSRYGAYTKRSVLTYLAVFLLIFAASLITVSKQRDLHYSAPLASLGPTVSSLRPILLHQLFVNRWIGLEGVIAVSAYEHKSMQLLIEMATERRRLGVPTRYQSISNSLYQAPNSAYQFATLPGIVAFLFYSGSLLVLFLGMAIFTLALLAIERLILALTQNPFLCALLGMTFANLLAQFGVTPRQDIPFVSMIMATVVGIAMLRSQLLARILTGRLRSNKAKFS